MSRARCAQRVVKDGDFLFGTTSLKARQDRPQGSKASFEACRPAPEEVSSPRRGSAQCDSNTKNQATALSSIVVHIQQVNSSAGPMDKAPAYGAGDSGFESPVE